MSMNYLLICDLIPVFHMIFKMTVKGACRYYLKSEMQFFYFWHIKSLLLDGEKIANVRKFF